MDSWRRESTAYMATPRLAWQPTLMKYSLSTAQMRLHTSLGGEEGREGVWIQLCGSVLPGVCGGGGAGVWRGEGGAFGGWDNAVSGRMEAGRQHSTKAEGGGQYATSSRNVSLKQDPKHQ
jgi:hypothetical protein